MKTSFSSIVALSLVLGIVPAASRAQVTGIAVLKEAAETKAGQGASAEENRDTFAASFVGGKTENPGPTAVAGNEGAKETVSYPGKNIAQKPIEAAVPDLSARELNSAQNPTANDLWDYHNELLVVGGLGVGAAAGFFLIGGLGGAAIGAGVGLLTGACIVQLREARARVWF